MLDPGSNGSQELVTRPKTLFESSLDEPAPLDLISGTVLVRGWAFSEPEPISWVEVWLDKTCLGQASYGFSRPDVARSFEGQLPDNCGFRGLLDFNPLLIGEGAKRLCVLIGGRTGQQFELNTLVQVQLPQHGATAEAYRQWRQQHDPDEATLAIQRRDFARLKTPELFRLELVVRPDTELSHLQATLGSLQAQTYSAWELHLIEASQEQWADFARQDERIWLFEATTTTTTATQESGAESNRSGWLTLLEVGAQLAPQALFRLYEWGEQHPNAVAVYADEDWLNEAGEPVRPFFKPDWSPEYLRQTNYIGPVLALRQEQAAIALGELELSNAKAALEPALAVGLRLAERSDLEVSHLPELLCHRLVPVSSARLEQQAALVTAHLARTGRTAVAEQSQSRWKMVALPRSDYPRLSLLLSSDQASPIQLENYLNDFFETVRYPNLELLILTKNSCAPRLELPVPVHYLRFGERTGLAAMFNQAVAYTAGDYLLFMDQLGPVLTQNWPEELLRYAEQPGVGGVGGLILTEHNTVAAAGLRLHSQEGVLPVLRGYPIELTGHDRVLRAAREVSTLNLQGLMLKKGLFEQLGGFNPFFESRYAGPDFCLRLRQAGFRVIFTPEAALRQVGPNWLDDNGNTLEKMLFLDIWQAWVPLPDQFYNPNFNQSYSDYRI